MELSRDKPRMIRKLNHLHQVVVRADTAEDHSFRGEKGLKCIVHFVAVAMPFVDEISMICLVSFRSLLEVAGVRTQPHRPAVLFDLLLFQHHIDHILIGLLELGAVGLLEAADIAGELDDRTLQAEANAKEWYALCPDISDGDDFPLDPPLTESGGDKQTGQ